jgi:hypothetical protein
MSQTAPCKIAKGVKGKRLGRLATCQPLIFSPGQAKRNRRNAKDKLRKALFLPVIFIAALRGVFSKIGRRKGGGDADHGPRAFLPGALRKPPLPRGEALGKEPRVFRQFKKRFSLT